MPLGRNEKIPAPGYRRYYTGALNGISNFGFIWSSATSGISGLDLHFGSQGLSASYSDYRAHGFQLRCLSE